ncbi:PD-(D/E)XK nuclease family protein [Sorangium sp. So ce834]|uniref:PD-(D/E)XK nuclease family protein n=1 Tax=Sorangium sp. So ce834 TaxID=3133321 RepID=UPI003F61F7D1
MVTPVVPDPAERLAYYRQLAERWTASRPPAPMLFVDYLRELARRAISVEAPAAVVDEDLDLFRRLVMERPEDLRRRLLGANVQRLRALDREQRAALRTLEVSPDLLSPLGELRYEPAHSRLLGYFLDRRRVPGLAEPLLEAVLAMIEAPTEAVDDDSLSAAVASTEVVVPGGRVDLQIESPALLAFVEIKVHATEGPSQLQRYRTALDARAGARAKVLAFLTLPGAEGPPTGLSCIHVTFADLLSRWLPLARSHDDTSAFLARYLRSVARLLGYAGQGPFEHWTFADQRSALDFVSQVGAGGFRDGHL